MVHPTICRWSTWHCVLKIYTLPWSGFNTSADLEFVWRGLPDRDNLLEVVTYMSPVEAFVIAIKMFDQQTMCLVTWSFPSEALECLVFRVKGQIAAARSWCVDFSSSKATLIPWLAPQKSFDRLIQLWSQSQTLLLGTHKWLPLDLLVGQVFYLWCVNY